MKPILSYYKLDSSVPDLEYKTEGSACFDLRAFFKERDIIQAYSEYNSKITIKPYNNKIRLLPFDRAMIPTGIIFDIPVGYCLKIYPRSSVGYKLGLSLSNSVGIIDWDYVDPVYLLMINNSSGAVEIENGERLCQAELVKIEQADFSVLTEPPSTKTNRIGGIGSTGRL